MTERPPLNLWIFSGLCWLLMVAPGKAQFGGIGGGVGGVGGVGGIGGIGNGAAAGIVIDPEGVVQVRNERQLSPAAQRKQVTRFAEEQLPASLIVQTPQRVLSLRQLETQIRKALDEKSDLPLEVLYLAGLNRIDAVVFDPEARDVYLVGPAEAFGPDRYGRMVGQKTGRPAMRLDDLVTAMRAMGNNERSIGCSIDPTPENLQALQDFLARNSTPATAGQVQLRFKAMANILGPQEISVWGVPADSHFAIALVEADVRMKRISLGLDSSGVSRIRSHLSLLRPQGNSLQRWWFVPMYEPLEVNPSRTVFKLKGQRAKLLSQEELTDADGNRTDAALTRSSTEKFAQLFTDNFQELADKSAPFAELQNLYDLAVVAALIHLEGRQHLGPELLPVLTSNDQLQLPRYSSPRTINSSSTFRAAGNGTMLGLVGGVTMDLDPVVRGPRITEGFQLDEYRNLLQSGALFGDGSDGSVPAQ